MVRYTIERVSAIIHAQKISANDAVIDSLFIDSRRMTSPSTALFFALTGPRRNGQFFIPELYQRGVRSFVVNRDFKTEDYPEGNFLIVDNTLIALQQLASFHRSAFRIPVIGITGSNGKTIVKEWLNLLLEKEYHIVRSPRSYNSQIGVPLSVWQMDGTHTLGIFEAGISQPGEMEALQKIIQPTIGVLTHIGDAHDENFTGLPQKIKEKLYLFRMAEWIVCHGDNPLITDAVEKANIPAVYWGMNENCQVQLKSRYTHNNGTFIELQANQHLNFPRPLDKSLDPVFTMRVPFIDDASVENAITCCCVLMCLGYTNEVIQERIALLKPVTMRLEMKRGINNCSIINDSYIADLSSLRIALDFLLQQKQHDKRTVILSDFLETGIPPEDLYPGIALALEQKSVNRFIGIGSQISKYRSSFESVCNDCSFYNSAEDFIANFHSNAFRDETVLIKGARVFSFERVSRLLEQKAHQTVLEINLNSIVHNLKKYQELLQPSTKIMAMVKAFSYGSGSFEIANVLQFQKIDYLAVAYTDEGVELRKAGITLPIMVMNPEENSFSALTEHYLEPEIFSFTILAKFQDHLREQAFKQYPVHVKIDTGMHRLGFELQDIQALCDILRNNSLLSVQSVFSHLAGSEDPQLDDFTNQQAEVYGKACQQLQQALNYSFIRHIANSAAVVRHPSLHFDMVRLGIGLYGVDGTANGMLGLKEAATLKTTIAQIKKIKAQDTVGYGRKGIINKDSTIATIRIGYADGYSRSFSNGVGHVLVHGHKAPVAGNIAMDMTMIDITGISDVQEDDEVIVLGKGISLTQLAQWGNTIPYEIMTGISQRVQRVYFEE
ncbi:MAG TPA: bifunctional UDP-N-acetylmuramoyl-tripeptide:D-alanyl-D-alanine ligase/alanine racemase [Agriterribacter sp.]|nr:bifunctional UDP-N-acetylmuramoyl-tripeptide:D-alanyl-D-alanine ligase/alanine racemase [Agriterribacter sp.]